MYMYVYVCIYIYYTYAVDTLVANAIVFVANVATPAAIRSVVLLSVFGIQRMPVIHRAITTCEASMKLPVEGKFLGVLGAGLPIETTKSCTSRASSNPGLAIGQW